MISLTPKDARRRLGLHPERLSERLARQIERAEAVRVWLPIVALMALAVAGVWLCLVQPSLDRTSALLDSPAGRAP